MSGGLLMSGGLPALTPEDEILAYLAVLLETKVSKWTNSKG